MRIAPLAEIKAKFSEFVDACQQAPVVVTRRGKAVAMLIPVSDDDLDSAFLANNPRFIEIVRRAQQQVREGRGIPEDEFWRRAAAPADPVDAPQASSKARKNGHEYRVRQTRSPTKPIQRPKRKTPKS